MALAVGLFSTSPVLVRWAAPLSPSEITFGRLAIAAAAVGLLALVGVGRPAPGPAGAEPDGARATARHPSGGRLRTAGRFGLYGLVAALHFLLYIASLELTTIAHSLSLVYTAPVFVTLFAALLLRERLRPRQVAGIPVVVAGIGILAGFEPQMSPTMALGDALALGSAVCFGLYSVAGRRERAAYPLLTYAGAVYLAAALWLAPVVALGRTGRASSPDWEALAAVGLLGVLPLAVGHTLYNASLRRTHPTYVNLVSTQEVTGGILLGFLLLGEAPGPATLLGAGLSLAGVALVLLL